MPYSVEEVGAEYPPVRNRLLGIALKIAPRRAVIQSAEEIKSPVDDEVCRALDEGIVSEAVLRFGILLAREPEERGRRYQAAVARNGSRLQLEARPHALCPSR